MFSYSLPTEEGYDPVELRVFLLKKYELPEQKFVEIRLDGCAQKSGHIFPLRLYETENTDFIQESTVPRFRRLQKVAIAAFCHIARAYLLKNTDDEIDHNPISLLNYFGDDTVVLTISNDTTRTPSDFDLSNYLPSLFKYGFLKHNDQGICDAPFESIGEETSLTLRRIGAEIPNLMFFKSIFTDLLPISWSPITSFFLCYQVIESCIEEIRLNNCNEFIAKLEAAKHDAVKTRSTLTEYSGESSEKERIKKLFQNFLSQKPEAHLTEGRSLLVRLGEDSSKLVDDYVILYSLRNYFFHAFPLVQSNCNEEQLRVISWECLLLTLEILCHFKSRSTAIATL